MRPRSLQNERRAGEGTLREARDRKVKVPHLTTPHTARIALLYRHATEAIQAELTFAIRDTSDAIFAVPITTAVNLYSAFTSTLAPFFSPEVVLRGVTFEDVRTIPYGGLQYDGTEVPGAYGGGDAPIPTDSALAISRFSAVLGRSNRGRIYWPIWDRAELSSADTVLDTHWGDIVDALNSLAGVMVESFPDLELGMISQQTAGVVRANGLFVPTVLWGTTDGLVDSQRRRLLGRGR